MSTWDVTTNDGKPVATLADLGSALFTTREGAAKQLLADPVLIEAAPEALVSEAKALLTPLPPVEARAEAEDAAATLVATVAAHDTKCSYLGLPAHARVTGDAVQKVYQRGIGSWPGEESTTLSAKQWALGRVEHFVKVATGTIATKSSAGHDTDLLHHEHPLAEAEVIHVSADDVEQEVKRLIHVGIDQSADGSGEVVMVDAEDVAAQIRALTIDT